MGATATPTRTEFDTGIAERIEEAPDYEQAPWFCLRTDSFPCPAEGCDFVALFITAAHMIVVWPAEDDPQMLWHAHLAAEVGRNPRVARWQPEFGRCIAFDLWTQLGRPVHGRLPEPEGWDAHGPAWGGK